MTFVLEQPFAAYDAGTELRDVTLAEARAMECNRCGDCCNGLRSGVKTDETTGLPLFTWGSKYPADLYEARYGQRMLIPIVMGDGGPRFGEAFEVDADGKPYTAFGCSFLEQHDKEPSAVSRQPSDPATSCGLYDKANPLDLSTLRPRNCGEFPVFGMDVDGTIIEGHPFVIPVGALPRCTWYGLRVTGPWKEEPYWRERWEKQQRGEEVENLSITDPEARARFDAFVARLLARRETIDGSVRKVSGDEERGVHPREPLDPAAGAG